MENYPSFMAKRFADFTVYRNRTLQKWHDKTKLASGKLGKVCVCLRVSIAVKRHHDHSNSYKGKHLIGVAYSFTGLAHFPHGREHGGMQADTVLEK